jgi:DNA processing protein
LKFNRKVFAVPGPITSQMSKGPYALIQKGAKLVTSGEDILRELKFEIRNSKSEIISKSKIQKGETKEEDLILKILQNEPLHFDELVRRIKFSSSKLSSILSLMEIKGLIKNLSGGTYSIQT